MRTHKISLTTAFGDVVESEEIPEAELGAALRRFHGRALARGTAVVVLDGVSHTRASFLELVRQFNECAARTRAPQAALIRTA